MKILSYLLFWVPLSIAWGSVNEPMRWEIDSGYRNDTLHWHLKQNDRLIYSEHNRNLQFWENALSIRVIYRDLAVFIKGAYGALGRGSLEQRYTNLNFTSEPISFSFHSTGWTADGWGYFGYAVNLTPDRTYKVILIPLVGYGVDDEYIRRHGTQRKSGAGLSLGESYLISSSLPRHLHMCWYGPLFGGLFKIQPGGRLQFETGYTYHRLYLRFISKMQTDVSLFASDGIPFNEMDQTNLLKVKNNGNLAHTAWANMDYILSKEWHFGLFAQIQYLASRILEGVVKDASTRAKITDHFKARWTACSGAVTISRRF